MATQYGIVLVTAGSRDEAMQIAKALVHSKQAACASLTPIHSVYTWEGEVCSEDEWQLVIKTDLAQFDQLSEKIQELHSYDVPEIIALPTTAGSAAYLQWISNSLVK
ncbi:MAG: divalent-cation tolerance protein CutA [Microcoleaceae cyanobacterium]